MKSVLDFEEKHFQIRETFIRNYSEIGVYRWLNKNIDFLKIIFFSTFLVFFIFSFVGLSLWFITAWAFAFIGLITLGGIDHLYIGLKLKGILKKLEKKQIFITLEYLLWVCEDLADNYDK